MSEARLIEAVKGGDRAAVEELVAGGADLNEQDENGWTPLNWAAGGGDVEVVRLLLDKGAEVFKVGRDQRTPYMIALAAGRQETARLLREAEEAAQGESASRPERRYCSAYEVSRLREFPGWPKEDARRLAGNNGHAAGDSDAEAAENEVIYLHQDFTVTRLIWHNEDVVFDQVTPEWKEFCVNSLKFKVPDDLDLISPVSSAS
jgi:ankyrin repeat protein